MGVGPSSTSSKAEEGTVVSPEKQKDGRTSEKKRQVRISRRRVTTEAAGGSGDSGGGGGGGGNSSSRSSQRTITTAVASTEADGGVADDGSVGGFTSLSSLSSALIDAFMDEIEAVDDGPVEHSSLDEEFYACVPELHLARAEVRVLDMMEWLAAMQECSAEADESAVSGSTLVDQQEEHRTAVLRHEMLRACESQVQKAAKASLSQLSKERKSMERKGLDSKAIRQKMKQLQKKCDKLGLETVRSDGRHKHAAARDGTGGAANGKGDDSAAAKRRDAALLSLDGACGTACDVLLHSAVDAREGQSSVFQEAREIFKRCLILGAEREAVTAYGKHLHGMLKKGLEFATTPLDRRRATKKGLSKMRRVRSSQSTASEMSVQLDDSEDPQPHVTAMSQVLGFSPGAVSVVLVEIQETGRFVKAQAKSPSQEPHELEQLLITMLKADVCLQASKVLRDFKEETSMDKIHLQATSWLEGDRTCGHLDSKHSASAAPRTGYADDAESEDTQPDVHELARLLDEATDVVALCQHFLASLRAPGALAFDQRTVSELPLFADALSLTAQYVDLETVYCLFNLSRVIELTAPMQVTTEVYISAVAEQAFFILRDKTLQRASETLAEQAILAICSRVVEALDTNAPEPSLYSAIRQLPMAQCGEVVKAADDAYRLHARRVRDEKTSTKTSGRLGFGASATPSVADATITATRGPAAVRSKQPEFPQRGADGGSGAAYLSRVDSQDDPEEGDSLSKFLGSLEQQMEEDVAGADALSDDGWTQLVAVVIATNSADACAQSIEALQVHIEDLLTLALERNPYLDCKLADKLAVTSIADLDRIAKAYADLRNSWVDQLTEMLSPAIDDLRVALRSRFSEGRNGHATKQSNSIGERAASSTGNLYELATTWTSPAKTTSKPGANIDEESWALPELLRSTIFDRAAFYTIQHRLSPRCFGTVLQHLTARLSSVICDAIILGSFDESSSLELQRETRDVEMLIGSFAPPGYSTTAAFARLTQTMLLINLESPGDLQLYRGLLDRDLMGKSSIRSVLYSRFPKKLVDCCSIPD